jgi:hypothetical protein
MAWIDMCARLSQVGQSLIVFNQSLAREAGKPAGRTLRERSDYGVVAAVAPVEMTAGT